MISIGKMSDEDFDEAWYLQQNPDVARTVGPGGWESGLQHYLLHGKAEGRLPNRPDDFVDLNFDDIRCEARRNSGAGYLVPDALRTSHVKPLNVAMIGSCNLQCWDLSTIGEDLARSDTILINSLSELPARSSAQIMEYDFALIQVPLRGVMGDTTAWRIENDNDVGFQVAFDNCCERLELQLRNWLLWNRKYGLLTFVCNFMVPQFNPNGRFARRYHLSNAQYFVEKLNEKLEAIVRRNQWAYLLDVDRISSSLGRRYVQDDVLLQNAHNALLDYTGAICDRIDPLLSATEYYEIKWRESLRPALWAEMTSMYRTVKQVSPVKLLVIDLDDTLWKGISGEMAEIDAGMMTEGWPMGLAEALIYLRKRGLILAILSKNDQQRVKEIFPKIWGKKILWEDFAAVTINWRPKPENMADMLATMNLLPRNVVFIDDNPSERAAMQAAFPDMRILGRHLYYIRRILLWSAETDVVSVTEESTRRTEMVQRQFERENQRKTLSRDDFLASAAPQVEILQVPGVVHPRFPRVLELINKTNQFNTTGRRWRAEELAALVAAGGGMFAFNVTDSFTNYGLVGVVLVEGPRIVQWVMSCRVLGYQIEQAVMHAVVPLIRRDDGAPVSGRLIETDVNFPCRALFSSCGFEQQGDEWVLPGGVEVVAPAHVEVKINAV